jgi:hypothetical protein
MIISIRRAAELLRVRYENDLQIMKLIVGNLLKKEVSDSEIVNSLKKLGIKEGLIKEAFRSLEWDDFRINEAFEEARRKDVNLHVLMETV